MENTNRTRVLCCALILLALLSACQRETATPTAAPTSTSVLPTPTLTLVPPTPTPTQVVYVIKPGDSLSGIAAKYGLTVDELAKANDISDPNVIRVDQQLVIPGPTFAPIATVPPTLTPTPDIPPELEVVEVIGRGAPGQETVIVANLGPGVDLEQWTLRDGRGNAYIFPKLYLASGAEVRVHTGNGENTPEHLYWGRDTAAWEGAGVRVILADARGVVYADHPLD